MTREEAKKFLAARLECIEQHTNPSGCEDECEACSLCYAQGNMGEQKEALRVALEVLERESMHSEIYALKRMIIDLVDDFKVSILSTIRHEITYLVHDDPEEDYEYGYNHALTQAAQIIDKYKGDWYAE